MSEAETLAVGKPRPTRADATPRLSLVVVALLVAALLIGATLGAVTVLVVTQPRQPDPAAQFVTDQRLAAYRAYSDEVLRANDVVDQAMAAVAVQRLDVEDDGANPDPTGATARALALERSRLTTRLQDIDILASEPVRRAFKDNQRAQDDVLVAVEALFEDGAVPSTEDYTVAERKRLAVRQQQAPATLVPVIRDELSADQ